MVGKDTWNERSLAAGLLLLGFLLVLPAVFINAPGFGANSAWDAISHSCSTRCGCHIGALRSSS